MIGKAYTKIIVALMLVLMFILATSSMAQKSTTVDETAHIPAGYSYWKTFDYRMNPEHPPLMKLSGGIPLLFLDLNFNKNSQYWKNTDEWNFGKEFLFETNNNTDQILFWSRIPIVLTALLLGFYVFKWSKELYGIKAGFIALFLYIFSPNILTHSRIVQTDMGITAFLFITVYYFWKFCKKRTKSNLIKTGIFLGLACSAKFTGIFLIPIIGILFFTHIYLKTKDKNFDKNKLTKYSINMFILIIIIGLIGLFILSLTYGFKEFHYYFEGLNFVINHSTQGHASFLMGMHSTQGWWYYFPLAFLFKTPIPTILLILSTITLTIFKKIKDISIKNELFIIIPIVLYLIAFMLNNINIGLRHILPIFPFIFVFVSKIINIKIDINYKKYFYIFLIIIGICYLLSNILIYPHYLAYFNVATGGPEQG